MTATATPPKVELALRHAGRGWRVFPLHTPAGDGTCSCKARERNEKCPVGKHPRIGDWQKQATTDSSAIKKWWKQWPDANIGIACGKESNLIVLDIDGEEGERVVSKLGTPKTATVITGKGRQLYFKYPGFAVKNRVGAWKQLDSRGGGGYVVAPGSLHASGKLYYFEEGMSPEDAPPAGAPKWWLDEVREGSVGNGNGSHSNGDAKDGAKKLVIEGRRNATLASIAGSLRDKGLSANLIKAALIEYNQAHCKPPLDEAEIEQIAASYGRYAEGDPDKKLKLLELARSMMAQEHFICSPIDQDGRGVVLMVYRDGSYKPHGSSVARSMALRGLGNAARPETITSCVELIKESTKKDDRLLNPDAETKINVLNGMLDWKTGELTEHDPSHLSSIQLPVEWDPRAKSHLLDKFLDEVLPEDAVQLAEEIVGYFAVPTTKYQKAVMLVGEGANGKSTFLNLINALLGPENISRISLHSLEESPFAAAELHGKLLNIYADLSAAKLDRTDTFKHLVGGDPLSAQRKYGQPFILHSFARLLFSANTLPRSEDVSEAYMRRWIVIPFPRRFDGKDRDVHLSDKLRHPEVLSAMLVRAVAGLRRLKTQGEFTKCASIEAKVEEYRVENDSCYEFASDTLVAAGGDKHLAKKEVWDAYERWCGENGIKFPMAPRKFNHQIMAHLRCRQSTARISGTVTKTWEGVAWKVAPKKSAAGAGKDKY